MADDVQGALPTSMSQRSVSSTMLGRLRSQEQRAWEELVKLFGPVLYEWCRRSGLQPEEAADVSQDVFLSAAVNLHTFHRSTELGSFRGWLWTITQNKIRDHFRRQSHRPVAFGGTDAGKAFANIEAIDVDQMDSQTGFDSRQAIMRGTLEIIRSDFDERTWRAFWLMAIDDRSSAEVGEQLGMSKDAVRQAKRRVLKRLNEELNELV
jgi:RNA polymerase sigma-70 factor, ECF subfamily